MVEKSLLVAFFVDTIEAQPKYHEVPKWPRL